MEQPEKPSTNTTSEVQKTKKPKKGIETMFKIASNSNQRRSKLADYKARNLITVNSIFISAIIGLLLKELDTDSYLSIPTYILLVVCVSTLVFAILATRPAHTKGAFKPEKIEDKHLDMLFFGNFYKMREEEYHNSIRKIMEDYDMLYDSMIKNIYSEGVFLGKQFRLLRIAYNIFMFGLSVSVLAFIIATTTV